MYFVEKRRKNSLNLTVEANDRSLESETPLILTASVSQSYILLVLLIKLSRKSNPLIAEAKTERNREGNN